MTKEILDFEVSYTPSALTERIKQDLEQSQNYRHEYLPTIRNSDTIFNKENNNNKTKRQDLIKRYYDIEWSIPALEDELTLVLSSTREVTVNIDTNHIEIFYKYYEYARHQLYRLNIYKPIPTFQISESDLPQYLVDSLLRLDPKLLNRVISEAIFRLYETIDFRYTHVNSIRGKIRWEII